MTAKQPTPMPLNIVRLKAPAAPPKKVSEIKVTIEYTTLEDGSRWCRMGDVFRNEWLEWVKL